MAGTPLPSPSAAGQELLGTAAQNPSVRSDPVPAPRAAGKGSHLFPPSRHSQPQHGLGHSHGSVHSQRAASEIPAIQEQVLLKHSACFQQCYHIELSGSLCIGESRFPEAKPRFLQGTLKNLGMLFPATGLQKLIPEEERIRESAALVFWCPH